MNLNFLLITTLCFVALAVNAKVIVPAPTYENLCGPEKIYHADIWFHLCIVSNDGPPVPLDGDFRPLSFYHSKSNPTVFAVTFPGPQSRLAFATDHQMVYIMLYSSGCWRYRFGEKEPYDLRALTYDQVGCRKDASPFVIPKPA